MIKKIIILILILPILSKTQPENKIVARVGKYRIFANQFKERYEDYLFATGMPDKFNVRMKILQDMINEILAYHYADNSEIFRSDAYKKEINWLRKQAVLSYLKDKEVYAKIQVSDKEARQAFRRMNQKIAVSHLYAKTKEQAGRLYDLLQKGISFESLAKEVFTDSLLKNNGGYLGYFSWGDLDPAFENAAFNLQIGEISKPVKTENGYSIIRLEDKIERPLLTEYEYQTRKKKIIAAVAINKKRPAERAYIESLINLDKFKFNDKCLKKMLSGILKDTLLSVKSNSEKNKNLLCVSYGNKKFMFSTLKSRLQEIPVYHLEKIKDLKSLKTVIKGIYLQDTLLQIAHRKGYDTLDIVNQKFNKMKMNLFMKLKQIEVLKNISLPDSVLYKFYQSHLSFFSTSRKVYIQEIVVNDSLLADSLHKLILGGEDFGNIAARYSINKKTAEQNGKVGFVKLDKFGKLKNTFWSSNPREIIGPVKLKNGWGLYKVIEREESKPISYNKVREEVEILAKYFYRKEYFEKYLKKLSGNISIQINKPVLGNIVVTSLYSNRTKNNIKFQEK